MLKFYNTGISTCKILTLLLGLHHGKDKFNPIKNIEQKMNLDNDLIEFIEACSSK